MYCNFLRLASVSLEAAVGRRFTLQVCGERTAMRLETLLLIGILFCPIFALVAAYFAPDEFKHPIVTALLFAFVTALTDFVRRVGRKN